MSSIKSGLLAMIAMVVLSQSANAVSVYFDFGYDNSASALSNYNDVIIDGTSVRPQPIELFNTIDSTGASTGIGLSAFGFFPGGNPNGVGTGGTVATGDAAATFIHSARVDNFFTHVGSFGGQNSNPKGEIVLTGLNDSTAYDFTFFASRVGVPAGDNRETMYTLTGSNVGVAYLNASNNLSNITSVVGIYPNAGSISINVEAGPNNNNGGTGPAATRFAYIGALRIDYSAVPEPTSLGLLTLSSLGLVLRRRFI